MRAEQGPGTHRHLLAKLARPVAGYRPRLLVSLASSGMLVFPQCMKLSPSTTEIPSPRPVTSLPRKARAGSSDKALPATVSSSPPQAVTSASCSSHALSRAKPVTSTTWPEPTLPQLLKPRTATTPSVGPCPSVINTTTPALHALRETPAGDHHVQGRPGTAVWLRTSILCEEVGSSPVPCFSNI